ncbi:MAG: EamA family transporter [Gammaproteobacteria bacterium]
MATPFRLGLAFAIVYLVWGSTYLAIRVAVQDVPPGLLAGLRFVMAGLVLTGFALLRHDKLPRGFDEWRAILIMAVALVVIGNGVVHWAEQYVASNLTALIISGSALWTAWFGTFGRRGVPLVAGSRVGLAIGMVGVALLIWPEDQVGTHKTWALIGILCSSLTWSAGAIYGRTIQLELSPLMFAGTQMFVGGAILLGMGLIDGQMARVQWTLAGVGGMAYLTVFGSCLAYSTYVWLIKHTTPARLATIAYVNPVVAAVLGWWLLDESLSRVQIAGTLIVLLGVVLVARFGRDQADHQGRR